MSQVLTEAFAGVRGDAQNQNRVLQSRGSEIVFLQARLQEVSTEISGISRSDVEPLKERCRKTEMEIVNLLRRVQDAQELANRVPELERELKIAKDKIGQLELNGIQAAESELNGQLMEQLRERLDRLEAQSQGSIPPEEWELQTKTREKSGNEFRSSKFGFRP